jgi:two-component system C4-dicarboxylate transport response regulator DctD
LIVSLRRGLQKRQLVIENRQLRKIHADNAASKTSLLGDSAVMVHLRQMLLQIADADVDVLITGDTGAGKESAARALHRLSSRRNRPFVQINCASLSDESFQLELFGAEVGRAFVHPILRANAAWEILETTAYGNPCANRRRAGG